MFFLYKQKKKQQKLDLSLYCDSIPPQNGDIPGDRPTKPTDQPQPTTWVIPVAGV